MLLDRDRIVRTAFNGRIVRDDHAVLALHDADPGKDARAGRIVVVHSRGGERRELEKVGARIEQAFDALPGGELVAPAVFLDRFGTAAGSNRDEALAQLRD